MCSTTIVSMYIYIYIYICIDTNPLYIPHIYNTWKLPIVYLSISMNIVYIYLSIYLYTYICISHPVTTHLALGYDIAHPCFIPCIYFIFNLLPTHPHHMGRGEPWYRRTPHTTGGEGYHDHEEHILYYIPMYTHTYTHERTPRQTFETCKFWYDQA